jgi:2-keto-3-deoxy-L-rhamnonate aldolase RhmA
VQGNVVKQKLARDELVVGTFVMEFASPGLARIVAGAGADFVVFDMEHSGWSFETVKQQIANARGASLVPIVNPRGGPRFAEHELLLDLGALGIMVPHVETAEQAAAIVRGPRAIRLRARAARRSAWRTTAIGRATCRGPCERPTRRPW